MKKLTFLALLAIAQLGFAQNFSVSDETTSLNVENGAVLTYTSLSVDDGVFWFWVKNESTVEIEVMAQLISMENSNGSAEFCMGGTCFYQITAGPDFYPVDPVVIAPGQNNDTFANKMWNYAAGINPNEPVIYKWLLTEVDENQEAIGDPFYFDYIYQPEVLGVADNEIDNNVSLETTVVDQTLTVKATDSYTFEIFNFLGQSVNKGELIQGRNLIQTSALNGGMYILRFNDTNGATAIKRFVVK